MNIHAVIEGEMSVNPVNVRNIYRVWHLPEAHLISTSELSEHLICYHSSFQCLFLEPVALVLKNPVVCSGFILFFFIPNFKKFCSAPFSFCSSFFI